MSLRQAIADALTSIPQVTGHPTTPPVVNAFDAWPQWTGTDVRQSIGRCVASLHRYDVLVALPTTDQATTAAAAQQLLPLLLTTLHPLGRIGVVDPATVALDAGSTCPALRVSITVPHQHEE